MMQCRILFISSIILSICLFVSCDSPVLGNTSDVFNMTQVQRTYAKLVPCLKDNRLVLGNYKFNFPNDAEAHYQDVLRHTAKYRNITMHEAAGVNATFFVFVFFCWQTIMTMKT